MLIIGNILTTKINYQMTKAIYFLLSQISFLVPKKYTFPQFDKTLNRICMFFFFGKNEHEQLSTKYAYLVKATLKSFFYHKLRE